MTKQTQKPPYLAVQMLRWVTRSADVEDIIGDLEEVYLDRFSTSGRLRARFYYWMDALSIVFSYALKKRQFDPENRVTSFPITMILSYFKIAVRNFSKHRLFTGLNILGLSLGMSVSLLALSLFVAIYESDDFQEHKESIYQVNTYLYDEANSKTFASTFNAVGNYLDNEFPFIEEVIKIKSGFSAEINHHGNLMEFNGYYVDNSFLEQFSFRLIAGNKESALSKPFSIVLTQEVAENLFRDEDPLGKILQTSEGDYEVTGIIENPRNTHLYFKVLASHFSYVEQVSLDLNNDWTHYRNNYVYFKVAPGTTESSIADALEITSSHIQQFHEDVTVELESIRLDQAVPRWNISNALGIGWDQPSMLFFLSIGLLVLLPAIFNYTNLSIARALKRAKEIGIRKVVGAGKRQIKMQFIVETILLAFLALFGSMAVYLPIKKEFLSMVIAAEVLDTSVHTSQVIVFIIFTFLIGLFAGIFPARFFSRLNPIHTMKGNTGDGKINVSGFKKGLFVFQFFLSLVFIIGVGAVGKQYAYVLNRNHGFDTNNILVVPFQGIDKGLALNVLQSHPDVKEISATSNLPGVLVHSPVRATPNGKDTLAINQVFVESGFVEHMKMEFKWQEQTRPDNSSRNEELVFVNETFFSAMSVFESTQDSMRFTLEDGRSCRVVGILEDFNYEPLSEDIHPLLLRSSIQQSEYALLTVNSPNIKKTISELEQLWYEIDQEIRFESSFLDDEIERAYYFLAVQIKFFSFLSALAITISCLGLLGMVSYTTENRTKEMAVRKILGASNNSLYYLLTKDFVKLIAISASLAIPFSYFFYDKLFLYFLIKHGTGLGVLEIFAGITFLFLVGFTSIFWQTSRVAKANPAGNLRYE